VKPFEIKIVLWLFVSILIVLSALGVASRTDLQSTSPGKTPMSRTRPPAPLTDEPLRAAQGPSAVEMPSPPPPTSPSPLPGVRRRDAGSRHPPRNRQRSLHWRASRPGLGVRSVA
jgi:hypothetical protein